MSKRTHCTAERDGRPVVKVRVERVSASSSKPPPKSQPSTSRRRKAPPKEINIQTTGSLRLSAQELDEALRVKAEIDSPTFVAESAEDLLGFEDTLGPQDSAESPEDGEEDPKERKTKNWRLREWLVRWFQPYMHAFYDRDAPPETGRCDNCPKIPTTLYRCLSCFGSGPTCSGCLAASHRFQPTHRIQEWDGQCWVESTLSKAGVTMCLGHGGKPCDDNSNRHNLTVVDLDGQFKISVQYCTHSNTPPKPFQLIAVGFFPCSSEHPRTALTLRLLDMYDAFVTLGRTSGYKYWSVLQRVTKPGFPGDVADRYRELMWTHRRYLYVLKQRRAGYGFQAHPTIDVHPGDQAFDCAKKTKAGDLCLSDGLAYFNFKGPFKEWLLTVPQSKKQEKPVCDHHKAGQDKPVKLAGKSISGMGAFTCTSHSCFVPCGACDFERGELFAYADYSFASAYHYLKKRGRIPVGMTYDVWCHWIRNFFAVRAPRLPPDLAITKEETDLIGAVPKWHLVGHDRQCFIRWALDFMQNIGRLDGEGPECIWSLVNEHSGSTSEQSPGQRTDTINNVAGDINFEKAIGMVRLLPSRFLDAKKMYDVEKLNYNTITSSFEAKKIKEWEALPI
ncbi:hypothetical protein FRC07_008967, partial [Ceratobasidium sp. 392]